MILQRLSSRWAFRANQNPGVLSAALRATCQSLICTPSCVCIIRQLCCGLYVSTSCLFALSNHVRASCSFALTHTSHFPQGLSVGWRRCWWASHVLPAHTGLMQLVQSQRARRPLTHGCDQRSHLLGHFYWRCGRHKGTYPHSSACCSLWCVCGRQPVLSKVNRWSSSTV